MKSGTILDLFGSLILLAAIAVVVRNPGIVSTIGTQFNTALGTATRG